MASVRPSPLPPPSVSLEEGSERSPPAPARPTGASLDLSSYRRARSDAQKDHQEPEIELMARVRDGDVSAFEEVVKGFWSRTLLYAVQVCNDPDVAYDVSQEAFIRLWKRRKDWVQSGSVCVWLFRTVRNLFIDEDRKRKARVRLALRFGAEERCVPPTPLKEVETLELRAAITEAVKALPARRREAFVLFHYQGLSYREIADVMDVRPQTVANYLQAAVGDLRILLAPHFPALAAQEDR